MQYRKDIMWRTIIKSISSKMLFVFYNIKHSISYINKYEHMNGEQINISKCI